MQFRREWWFGKRAKYFGEIDLGDGRSLPAEDVLEGHYRRLTSARGKRQLAPVQVGDNLIAAISVLAPNLSPLAELAEDVAVAMPPVHPAPQFRRHLHEALELTHRQQSAHRILGTRTSGSPSRTQTNKWVVLLAAATMLLSVAIWWQTNWRRSESRVSLVP